MKQDHLFDYVQAVKVWDRSHRMVGRESIESLCDQSIEALNSLVVDGVLPYDAVVDVGAGSGLVGFPLLFNNPNVLVAFVEPDLKKTSFIVQFLSTLPQSFRSRVKIFPQNVEDVSRETLKKFCTSDRIALLARAFSGPKLLNDSIKASKLSNYPLFQFKSCELSQKNGKYIFEHLKLS